MKALGLLVLVKTIIVKCDFETYFGPLTYEVQPNEVPQQSFPLCDKVILKAKFIRNIYGNALWFLHHDSAYLRHLAINKMYCVTLL